jgi:hypothetical protein
LLLDTSWQTALTDQNLIDFCIPLLVECEGKRQTERSVSYCPVRSVLFLRFRFSDHNSECISPVRATCPTPLAIPNVVKTKNKNHEAPQCAIFSTVLLLSFSYTRILSSVAYSDIRHLTLCYFQMFLMMMCNKKHDSYFGHCPSSGVVFNHNVSDTGSVSVIRCTGGNISQSMSCSHETEWTGKITEHRKIIVWTEWVHRLLNECIKCKTSALIHTFYCSQKLCRKSTPRKLNKLRWTPPRILYGPAT